MLGSFARDVDAYLTVIVVSPATMSEAIEAARTFALRPADSIQAASAKQVRDVIEGSFVLVTSDQELQDAGLAASMEVLNPEADGAMTQLRRYRGMT